MVIVKKNYTTNVKAKNVVVSGNMIIDEETGEVVPIFDILEASFGSEPFELSATQKTEQDTTPDEE